MGRRLLILPQVVDADDPVLGFFHGWIEALASRLKALILLPEDKRVRLLEHARENAEGQNLSELSRSLMEAL